MNVQHSWPNAREVTEPYSTMCSLNLKREQYSNFLRMLSWDSPVRSKQIPCPERRTRCSMLLHWYTNQILSTCQQFVLDFIPAFLTQRYYLTSLSCGKDLWVSGCWAQSHFDVRTIWATLSSLLFILCSWKFPNNARPIRISSTTDKNV
jgi:hypothetical protein